MHVSDIETDAINNQTKKEHAKILKMSFGCFGRKLFPSRKYKDLRTASTFCYQQMNQYQRGYERMNESIKFF